MQVHCDRTIGQYDQHNPAYFYGIIGQFDERMLIVLAAILINLTNTYYRGFSMNATRK